MWRHKNKTLIKKLVQEGSETPNYTHIQRDRKVMDKKWRENEREREREYSLEIREILHA